MYWRIIALSLCSMGATSVSAAPVYNGCDLAFLVETSERVMPDLDSYLRMALDIQQRADLSAGGAHAALVHFSSTGRTGVLYNLDQGTDYAFVKEAVDNMNRTAVMGISDLDWGLTVTYTGVYKKAGMDRPGHKNIVILVAEGYFDRGLFCCPAPYGSGAVLRTAADVYAVMVGRMPDYGTLVNITGDKSGARVFDQAEYARVVDVLKKECVAEPVSTTSTMSTTSTTTTSTTPTTTTSPACAQCDVLFVMDSSESITLESFDIIKRFAGDFAPQYTVAADATRFGVLAYSTDVFYRFGMRLGGNETVLKHALDIAPYQPGLTNTSGALKIAAREFDDAIRPFTERYIITFTDGRHTLGSNPTADAEVLRDKYKATIFGFGVPGINGYLKPVDTEELRNITGVLDHMFVLTDAHDLPAFVKVLQNMMPCPCEGRSTTTAASTTTTQSSTTSTTAVPTTSTVATSTTTTTPSTTTTTP